MSGGASDGGGGSGSEAATDTEVQGGGGAVTFPGEPILAGRPHPRNGRGEKGKDDRRSP